VCNPKAIFYEYGKKTTLGKINTFNTKKVLKLVKFIAYWSFVPLSLLFFHLLKSCKFGAENTFQTENIFQVFLKNFPNNKF
jgi:hypothetical protein